MNGSFADDWDSRGDGPAGGDDGLCGLDDELLERLLEATDAESLPAPLRPLAEVLVAVRAPATAEELAGEADAVAQFRATRSRQNLAWTARLSAPAPSHHSSRRRRHADVRLGRRRRRGDGQASRRPPRHGLADAVEVRHHRAQLETRAPADSSRPRRSRTPAVTNAGGELNDSRRRRIRRARSPRSTPRPPQRDAGTQRSTRRPRLHTTRPQSPRPRSPSNRSSRSNRSTAPPPTSSQRRQAHRPRHRPSRRQHRPPHRHLSACGERAERSTVRTTQRTTPTTHRRCSALPSARRPTATRRWTTRLDPRRPTATRRWTTRLDPRRPTATRRWTTRLDPRRPTATRRRTTHPARLITSSRRPVSRTRRRPGESDQRTSHVAARELGPDNGHNLARSRNR